MMYRTVRPIRVVIRTSRADKIPRCGSAVTGHWTTASIFHGAMVRASRPDSGRPVSRHQSVSPSAPVASTKTAASGIAACQFPLSFWRGFPPLMAATVAARWRGPVTVHPVASVSGSALGARTPATGSAGCEPECEGGVPAPYVQTRGPFTFAFTMTGRRRRPARSRAGPARPGPLRRTPVAGSRPSGGSAGTPAPGPR